MAGNSQPEHFSNGCLKEKTVLITGGTSRLGESFVLRALRQGAKVFFTYQSSDNSTETLNQKGARGFKLDLADISAIDLFAKEIKNQTSSLDVLIHNAAAVRDHSLMNLTEEEWDYVMKVNLKAPYYLTKKLLPFFLKGRFSATSDATTSSGRTVPKKIFFITSRAAVIGGFGISNYAASKAGLIGLSKSLAQELGSRRVLVNSVNPGFMKSRMTESLPPDVIEANRLMSPIEEFSNPEEVADFLVFLCSDQMSQVTGQTFHFESRKI